METQAPTTSSRAVLNEKPRARCREAHAVRSVLGPTEQICEGAPRAILAALCREFSGLADALVAAALMLQYKIHAIGA